MTYCQLIASIAWYNIRGEQLAKLFGQLDMDYTVVIHPAEEGGYWTEIPALPGCFSQGETMEEALANTKEAIESHLAALREDGQEAPCENGLLIGHVNVAA
jgi:predicted RNase H-like HicB family nuclease